MEPFIIGVTGASGALYAHRLLRHLKDLGAEVHLVLTEHGRQVVAYEGQKEIYERADKVYRNDDLFAPIASGSFRHRGMIIAPCTMATLGKLANGIGDSLLARATPCISATRRSSPTSERSCCPPIPPSISSRKPSTTSSTPSSRASSTIWD
jgi:flavin prenyltransferase